MWVRIFERYQGGGYFFLAFLFSMMLPRGADVGMWSPEIGEEGPLLDARLVRILPYRVLLGVPSF